MHGGFASVQGGREERVYGIPSSYADVNQAAVTITPCPHPLPPTVELMQSKISFFTQITFTLPNILYWKQKMLYSNQYLTSSTYGLHSFARGFPLEMDSKAEMFT